MSETVASPSRLQKLIVAVLLVALFIGVAYALSQTVVAADGYTNKDFMSVWGGARALLDGVNPFDPADWLSLRARYGSTWFPDDTAPFPLWTSVIFLPLALLPLQQAAAVMITATLLFTPLCVLLLLRLVFGERLGRAALLVVLIGVGLSRWVLLNMHIGQISVLMLLAVTGFLLLEKQGRAFWAGVALSFIIVKPNAVFLFVPLFGVWLIAHHRWQIIAGGLSGGVGLFTLSWLALPGWFSDWLSVSEKTRTTFLMPTVWGASAEIVPGVAPLAGLLVSVGLVALIGAYLLIWRRGLPVATVVSLCLSVSLLATPYTWPYEQLLLLVPMTFIFHRLSKSPLLRSGLWLGLTVVLPWFLYWVATRRGVDTLTILMPLIIGGMVLALATPAGAESQRGSLKVQTAA